MSEEKKPTPPVSFRLSADGKALLARLQAKLGLKRSGVVELALRRLAEAEGLSVPIEEGPGIGTRGG